MILSNKTYDALKWVVTIVMPAFAALYFLLAELWGLPKATEVVGTIAAVTTFLGVILGITSTGYKKANDPHAGYLQLTGVDPHTGMPDVGLTLTKYPSDLLGKKTITLKVDESTPFSVPTIEEAAAAPVAPE